MTYIERDTPLHQPIEEGPSVRGASFDELAR
jgi:hypothetical protein